MDGDINPREELYKRFKDSLTQPVGERFFDEDELVDIYDLAGDYDDDYVQLEVLLCGARLYPESQVLAERKALLYLDTTDENTDERTMAASNFLNDNPDASSLIFDIARLEVSPPEDGEAALEFLLNQYSRFDDEEVIRFVQLALNLDSYSWLIANLERIKSKVDFIPTLYYEIAHEADDINDNANLVKFAEALIEIEPFAPQYWMMLLRGQARLDKKDDARQTFDYAIALAGDSAEALLALTEICFNYAEYLLPQMLEPLKRLLLENPDEFRYVDAYCAVNSKLLRTNEVLSVLRDYGFRHPENPVVVHHLLNYAADDAVEYMDRYFAICGEEGLAGLAPDEVIPELAGRGNRREVIAYLERLQQLSSTEYISRLHIVLEFYYHCLQFDKVVELCEKYESVLENYLEEPINGSVVVYVYLFSLVKLKRHDEALALARKWRSKFEDFMKASYTAARMVVKCLLVFFDKLDIHAADDELYWEYFDMLRNGKF